MDDLGPNYTPARDCVRDSVTPVRAPHERRHRASVSGGTITETLKFSEARGPHRRDRIDIVELIVAARPREALHMKVALFITCVNDGLFPNTPRAVVEVLERLGHEVVFPTQQTCCGQMHLNAGYRQEGPAPGAAFSRGLLRLRRHRLALGVVRRHGARPLRDVRTLAR